MIETLHSVGLNIFIFALLPTVDPFTGVFLCMNVALLPSLLGLVYSGIRYWTKTSFVYETSLV